MFEYRFIYERAVRTIVFYHRKTQSFTEEIELNGQNCKNLYFAGEILDIDGITGGYNFQAAWTTGYIAGKLK